MASIHDREHAEAMRQTGFWGKEAAGCLFMAKDTKRLLIAHRSDDIRIVAEPGSWGTWGGALDPGETPQTAIIREVQEESGYNKPLQLIPLYVFQAKRDGQVVFQYHNFLAVVPSEFIPTLDRETQGYAWVKFGDWPQPLHPGLQTLLADAASVQKIRHAMRD